MIKGTSFRVDSYSRFLLSKGFRAEPSFERFRAKLFEHLSHVLCPSLSRQAAAQAFQIPSSFPVLIKYIFILPPYQVVISPLGVCLKPIYISAL